VTKKQVWQYRCEFCGKRGYSAGHMTAHEKRCTANPNRICRMHVYYEKPQVVPVSELVTALRSRAPDRGMAKLRELADNCPMCILAAVRQSGICKWDGDPENPPIDLGFNFKEELSSAWQAINDAKSDHDYATY
jgi:hypothetical protein